MLCVRAPKLEKQLRELVQLTGKTKSHYVRTALEWYLRDQDEEVKLARSVLPSFCLEEREEELTAFFD